ncbi:MAG: alpha-L-fucosidase [Ignavibacteriales bacterium]|nr:alpha-L-fucosidase [Ignavibacteriales bacterium]
MKKLTIVLVLTCLAIILPQQSGNNKNRNFTFIKSTDSPEQIISKAANVVPTQQQYNWQKMELIAFAHFGMNTFTENEWGAGKEDPKLFKPTNFDARQWIRTFKNAGIKMLILTVKHHDGFCLWPSKYTEHSVKNSLWKNGKGDVVREVSHACKEFGLKFGVYLSPWDRNNPDYGDSPKYNEYFCNQLRELLTNYGEITEVWFDGANGEGPNGKKQVYDWQSYYKVIRELQPNAVIFGMAPDIRWVGTESGYGRVTEWSVIPIDLSKMDEKIASEKKPLDEIYQPHDIMGEDLGSREKISKANGLFWYPAETDVSIRPGWFYRSSQDTLVKSPEKLVDIYFNSVGRNSVLLLNVPPDKRGLLTDYDIKSLMGMKQLLNKTFRTNLAINAKIKSAGMKEIFNASLLIDNSTYWATIGTLDTASIEFILPKENRFDVAMLQEEIRVGQRIEKFHLDFWNGTDWIKFADGTTVGYKRLFHFKPIKTNRVRLVIEQSRLNPTISNFGLYKSAE